MDVDWPVAIYRWNGARAETTSDAMLALDEATLSGCRWRRCRREEPDLIAPKPSRFGRKKTAFGECLSLR